MVRVRAVLMDRVGLSRFELELHRHWRGTGVTVEGASSYIVIGGADADGLTLTGSTTIYMQYSYNF